VDYVIRVAEGRLQESRERQCLTTPQVGTADEKPHVVLLRFKDREAVTPSAFCMVAVRAVQAGVEGVQVRGRCGVWGLTDVDFVSWIESQGGELYRNALPEAMHLLDDEGLTASTWCCQMGDAYGEGRYAFEAIAAALDEAPCIEDRKRDRDFTVRDDRLWVTCR
jgi:hypothetical protein